MPVLKDTQDPVFMCLKSVEVEETADGEWKTVNDSIDVQYPWPTYEGAFATDYVIFSDKEDDVLIFGELMSISGSRESGTVDSVFSIRAKKTEPYDFSIKYPGIHKMISGDKD